jgi:uncharacterized protein (TIGR02611 family)
LAVFRARLDTRPTLRRTYKICIGMVGTVVLAIGIVLIPYPGPGWLIVFAGLAILATEFIWAHRLLTYARARYDAWAAWLGRQHWSVKLLFFAATSALVLFTVWLLDGWGTLADWLGLDQWTWLQSPIL